MFDYSSARQHADTKRIGSWRIWHLVITLVNKPPRARQFTGNDSEEEVKSFAFLPASINHALRRHEVLPIQIPDLKNGIVPFGISSQLLQFTYRILEPSEVALLC